MPHTPPHQTTPHVPQAAAIPGLASVALGAHPVPRRRGVVARALPGAGVPVVARAVAGAAAARAAAIDAVVPGVAVAHPGPGRPVIALPVAAADVAGPAGALLPAVGGVVAGGTRAAPGAGAGAVARAQPRGHLRGAAAAVARARVVRGHGPAGPAPGPVGAEDVVGGGGTIREVLAEASRQDLCGGGEGEGGGREAGELRTPAFFWKIFGFF